MKRFLIVLILLLVVVATAVVWFLRSGKEAPKAADLLPDTTIVFFDISDFAKSRDAFRQTAAYALWQEPEMQAFLEKPIQSLRTAVGREETAKQDNFVRDLILHAMQGEAFLAVTHISIFPNFQPGLVIGVDVKRKKVETLAGLFKLESELKKSYPQGRFENKKYLGVSYSVWATRPTLEICQAFLNSMVVFTYGEDGMRDVIARFKHQTPEETVLLSASPAFQNVAQHVAPSREFLAYINVEQITNLVGPLLALSPQSAGMFQKMARIKATGNSVTFVDQGVQDVGYIAYMSTNPTPAGVTQRKTIALAATNTLLYAVGTSDVATSYEESMQSLVQSGNPSLASNALKFEKTLRTRNVRIREDVLARLGPEAALLANWRPGTRAPDVALITEITDEPNLRRALDATLDALKEIAVGPEELAPWETTTTGSRTLRTVRVGSGILAPTYTTTANFFILASNPDYARDLLAQVDDNQPTLATNADYQKALQRLPANGSSYTYCDLRALFEPLYGLIKSSLAQLGTNSVIEADKLPQLETFQRHLFPFVGATVSESQSETTTSFSPLGRPLVFVAGAAGGFWAAQSLGLTGGLPIPMPPTKSSSKLAPAAPPENQTAAFQIP